MLDDFSVSQDVLELDPREYEVVPASIDSEKFESRRAALLPLFQKIGAQMGRMGALPMQEEPSGSGKLVSSGNFSLRDNGDGFFITGSGVDKCHPDLDGILFVEDVDYENGRIAKAGSAKHSRETLIHDLIYRAFPGVRAVIHTHDRVALLYDASPTTNNPIFFANVREAKEVVELLKRDTYVQLLNHGQFIAAESVDNVLEMAVGRHRSAVRERVKTWAAGLGIAASVVLGLGYLNHQWNKKFEGCEVVGGFGGASPAVTYVCPTVRNCGQLKSWEGESEGFTEDGKYQCTFWIGGN